MNDQNDKFAFVILVFLVFIPIVFVIALSFQDIFQDSKMIEGTVQQKKYQEKKCTQEFEYDPALNITLPKENCKGPYWTITINNEQYQVTELLYNKLEIDSFYSFSYHPLKGMSLLNE